MKYKFNGLIEALQFIAAHGGQVSDVDPYRDLTSEQYEELAIPNGAFDCAGKYVRCADGSIFGVEAYDHGPLSEVTPDVDFGVILIGWTPTLNLGD